MDKTYRTEFCRRFLIEALPEPLTPASRHLQIFDNYITGTRIRIRSVRDPQNKEWSWSLQQRIRPAAGASSGLKVAEIYLSEAEHTVFEVFEGKEIRKNRYFHEVDRMPYAFDIYLGNLWGVNIATVDFADERSLNSYEPPPFAIFEITNDPFFLGESLVDREFEDVKARVTEIGMTETEVSRAADE